MPLKIVRNDIVKMDADAIVNTANARPAVGPGCDRAVYTAAGWEKLLAYRREQIGEVCEGDVFLTPGFDLKARYIIHAVSPRYNGGSGDEEKMLRGCYRKSLALAKKMELKSIAFPLISTGSFGYPREEGMRLALDEIYEFLRDSEMMVWLTVFDVGSARLGQQFDPELETYIDRNYVCEKLAVEYTENFGGSGLDTDRPAPRKASFMPNEKILFVNECCCEAPAFGDEDETDRIKSRLAERISHRADTFSEYLLYLIKSRGMKNADVYKRALVDKKIFSKIKNNRDYHPQKRTALCLCVGAQLNLDEAKDLLARAGYALSPCDMTDIIFSFFIENRIYDMIDLDIQLEEHGLPCIIE